MLERAAFMHRHSACCSRPEEGTKHAALITILNHRRDSEADSSLISNFIAVSCSLKTKAQTTNNTGMSAKIWEKKYSNFLKRNLCHISSMIGM